ncbi:MAG: hypothetical protein V1886_01935 [archaeon]
MPQKLSAGRNAMAYELLVLVGGVLVLLLFLMYFKTETTGHVVVSKISGQYYALQVISGIIDLDIEEGEFLPAQSVLKAGVAGNENSFTLEQLMISSGAGIEKKQGNFSVNDVDITGQGEGYGIAGGATISLNLSDFNLQVEEAGKYNLIISLEYNEIVLLTEQKKINVKSCSPDWKQHNTSCMENDAITGYYRDRKECYEKTGKDSYLLEKPENITFSCDYCTPNWKPKNESCTENETRTVYYADSRKCYEKTGLMSDLAGMPENETADCDFCRQNITQYATSCDVNDSFTVYYRDAKRCYEKTGLEEDKVPENETMACDYCTPNWVAVNTSCLSGDKIVEWYNDSEGCFGKTHLSSELLGRADNRTYYFACSYYNNNLIGDISDISTSIENLSMTLSSSADLTQPLRDLLPVSIKENGSELLEFNFNFSAGELNLADLTIQKQDENATLGFIAVNGIDIAAQNETKTVWVDRIGSGAGICIKDEENANAMDITAACSATNEIFVKCPGSFAGYACEFDAVMKKYKVSDLRHSAVIEQEAFCGDSACNGAESCSSCSTDCGECPAAAAETSAQSSGGGGSGGSCTPKWECSEWNVCSNGKQTRTCTNLKSYCPVSKPAEQQDCEMPSVPETENKEIKETASNETVSKQYEKIQPKLGMLGGVIGVVTAMPFEFRIGIAATLLSFVLVLITLIAFLAIIRKKK